jgi:branched-chain amino acid transport system substrate-binding protein
VRLSRVVVTKSAALTSAALVALAGGACTSATPTADTSPIVIGADLELSGAQAAIGNTYMRALQLRVDQLNAQGGVDGRRITLETKDNRSDSSLSVANVNALAAEPGIAGIIIGACSQCVTDVANTIDDKQIPTVTLAPASQVVRPVSDRRYIFKLGPNSADSATVLTGTLHDEGIHTVAVLSTDDVNGTDAVGAITGQATRNSLSVVGKQTFKATDTDLSQPVRMALAKNPGALVVSAFPGQAELVAKTARDAGYTGRLFFDATAAGDLFLTGQMAAATEGAIMVAPQSLVIDDVVATTPAKTARKRWFDDYTSKYGGFSGYSTYAADAVKLLADAVHVAGGPQHRKMRDVMEDTAFDGLSGQVRFTPDNHSGMMAQALISVVARSGRWRLFG